jgi:streptogramin lyase
MNLWGITFDVNGNMYVGGNATGNIYRVTSSAVQTLLGNVSGNAGEMTIGSDGFLYVAAANGIRRISSTGTVTTITPSYTDGSRTTFDNAASVRMGPDGNLYVLDCNNGRVVRMSKTGANAITFAGSTSGITSHLDGTGTNARLTFPIGSCMDSNGNLYTCDVNGFYIRKITPAGVVTTLAGSGVQGSTDGPVLSATLQAVGICIGPDGNLWFRNIPNSSVRKVTMSSALTPQTLYAFTGT